MTTLAASPDRPAETVTAAREARRLVRDSLIVSVGGQIERAFGTLTALMIRWGLDPARLGVYDGLRIYLDQTNRSSLGIGLGAVQEIPILHATGRHDEARRAANIACTANTITCAIYALVLLAWAAIRWPLVANDPLAAEWTWGLVVIAGFTLLQRRLSFHIAVLRAYQEFVVTTELDIAEAIASIALTAAGLYLAGFWGLLAAVGSLLSFKIAYLHIRHPLRFDWDWEWATAWRLMIVGLPIFANTAVFNAVLNLDRVLLLWLVPDGARAAGLYSVAILGTSWSLDLAGRIVTVLYPHFQTTLGRTGDVAAVVRSAARATEAQAPILAAGSAVACVVGPAFLGMLMPRYLDGLLALRPLLPGMLLLGLTWPARQLLITIGQPYRLCLATGLGFLLTATAGAIGAARAGMVGVAWGMTIGYGLTYVLTSLVGFLPTLSWRGWWTHQARLAAAIAWPTAGSMLAITVPLHGVAPALATAVRCTLVAVWLIPPAILWIFRSARQQDAA